MEDKVFEIVITVDTNDGDYATEIQEISKIDLENLKPLIAAIKNFKAYRSEGRTHRHNYATQECLRTDLGEREPEERYDFPEELFSIFSEFLPSTEYGFHTIVSIYVYPVPKKEKLL